MGTAACVEYAAGAGAPLRSAHGRGARLLPDRSRELARRSEPRRVKRVVRRRALLVGVGLLVAVLVGGRWLALETAERAWGASLPGGSASLTARAFGRLVSGLLLVGAIAWGRANLLFVYRSIGSMQLSRRLGDLEIVEAVPQPLLLAGTIACGLAFGFLLTLGTGDWWMAAALASRPPTFGVTDTVPQQDLGYYLGQLPWTERLRGLALVAVCSATVVVALLYVGIGSLRVRRWLAYADLAAERRRLEGLAFGITLTERPPPGWPSPEAAAAAVPMWDAQRVVAAAGSRRDLRRPQSTPIAAGLLPRSFGDGRATWLVALRPDVDSIVLQQPPPDWAAIHRGPAARGGRPLAAGEDDTGLAFAPVAARDSTAWFGPRFTDFAVATPDTWPALRSSGIALEGWWRRTALAWALQSPALARHETDGLLLLWRRDVLERLGRLAPFASFDEAAPVVADSALWWVAYGYFAAEPFP